MTQGSAGGLNQVPTGLPAGRAVRLHELTDYVPGSIVSRILLKNTAGTITLFAFDAGQGLSEHTSPYDATVQVLDGEAELTIGGKPLIARAGDLTIMPAGVPHAVRANRRFKMLLIMIR